MKKLFLILLISSFIPCFSQEDKIKFGLHGGIAFSNLTFQQLTWEDVFSTKTGFLLGVNMEYNLSKKWSLITNLSYESKGAKYNFGSITNPSNNQNFGKDETLTLSYLTLPIMIRYKLGNRPLRFFVNGGLFMGFLLNTKNKNDNNISDFKSIDVGYSIGIGIIITIIKKNTIFIEARQNSGIIDVGRVKFYNDGSFSTLSRNLIIGFTF